MTNIVADVTILLVTNLVVLLHPSGESKTVTRTVIERRVVKFPDTTNVVIFNRPLSTNITQYVWKEWTPPKRDPLSIVDPPLPPGFKGKENEK